MFGVMDVHLNLGHVLFLRCLCTCILINIWNGNLDLEAHPVKGLMDGIGSTIKNHVFQHVSLRPNFFFFKIMETSGQPNMNSSDPETLQKFIDGLQQPPRLRLPPHQLHPAVFNPTPFQLKQQQQRQQIFFKFIQWARNSPRSAR